MKYPALLVLIAAAWAHFGRGTRDSNPPAASPATPVPALTEAAPAAEARTNLLKRPRDRTNAALEQVKTRNGTGEF